jgi:hypothetical protein
MSAAPPDDGNGFFDPTRPPPPAAPPAEAGDALPAGTRLAEFELLGVVGQGGFGIVYRAWDHSLKRQVAIKEYMPSSLALRSAGLQVGVRSEKHRQTFDAGRQGFVKEARLLAQFDHPALVKVFRFWEANGSAYMVMPFYEGVTLRDALRQRTAPPDEATLLGWLGPVADALAILHAEHWYHRDIAPDNVLLLAGSHRPVLLDFGAARRVIGDMTQALTVILKPGYAPVEQYAEIPGMKQGPWTDVYALAALAYHAVCGRTPPPSVGRLVSDSLAPLSQIAAGRYSERVLRAIDHGLAVRPEDRTPSIAAFKAELGLAAPASEPHGVVPAPPATPSRPERQPVAVRTPPAAPPAAPAPGRRGLLAAAAAALTAGVGGAIWWSGRAGAPAPASVAVPGEAPAAVPAGTGYDAVDIFRRIVAAQTPGWGLELTMPATRLRPGRDKLEFTIRSQQDGHVHAFLHGSDGTLQQLYPNELSPPPQAGQGRALALPAGAPGFDVRGPAGVGHLLVIVSAWPRDLSAFAPRVEGGYASFPTGSVAAALEGANAGRLPLLAGQPQCPPGAACSDEFGAALLAIEVLG